MLADPRSEALATRFAAQWLRLQRRRGDPARRAAAIPYFDHTLGAALMRETELFFDSLVREDRSVLDLLTADYTFVNERLARHYGIPNVTGPEFRRVAAARRPPRHPRPRQRAGADLGRRSHLAGDARQVGDGSAARLAAAAAAAERAGARGDQAPPIGGKVLTVRERMEEHRKNPACTSCHRVIDPLGLALENFDVTGRWRIKDNGVPVDATGVLYDGTPMEGPAGLRAALLKHKDAFLLSFTENLMTYALGRRVEAYDMPAVRAIIREAAKRRTIALSRLRAGHRQQRRVPDEPRSRRSRSDGADRPPEDRE